MKKTLTPTVGYQMITAQKVFTITVPLGTTKAEGEGSATLTPGVLERSEIISAIIRMKYSASAMEAVINNHLLDSTDETATAEFSAMQAWRAKAKEHADKILEIAQADGMI